MRLIFLTVIFSSICSLVNGNNDLFKRGNIPVKSGKGESPLFDILSTFLGCNPRDFVFMEFRTQLDILISLLDNIPAVSQYLFARLNNPQRSQILTEANPFERYELFTKYDLEGKGILLASMSDDDISMITFHQTSDFMTLIIQKADESTRSKIIAGMGSKSLLKWFFYLPKRTLDSVKLYLDENQQKNLLDGFTRLRVNSVNAILDYEFLERINQLSEFLDELSKYYDRKDLELILHTVDPVLYLSRYTPKEKIALKNLMTFQEKEYLLELLQNRRFKTFPDDFFERFELKESYLLNGNEWDKFWKDMKFEVSNHDVKGEVQDLGSEIKELIPKAEKLALDTVKGLHSILPPQNSIHKTQKKSILS